MNQPPNSYTDQRLPRVKVPFWRTFLFSAFGSCAGVVLSFGIVILMISSAIAGAVGSLGDLNATSRDEQPERIVLSLDLREQYPDQSSQFAKLFSETDFVDVIRKIKRAETDDTVRGIFIRAGEAGIGHSRAEEIRTALVEFKETGKFVIAHSQGILTPQSPAMLRAIAPANEIWVQPGSYVMANGLSVEGEFFKGLLDKLSISADIIAMHEYKNAPNTFQQETYTAPHREAVTAVVESVWRDSISTIATDRGLEVDTVRNTLESGFLSAEQMIESKLADQTGWPEDAIDAAIEKGARDSKLLEINIYQPPAQPTDAPVIAILGGEGVIETGTGEVSPFDSSIGFISDRVVEQIEDVAEIDSLKAIVFRVDSPGGSATASDQIHRAIIKIKEEKSVPVVVSMGSVAASGGYYVSAGADAIVASGTTITGSIGIFGGKFAISEGLKRIGVNMEDITVGSDIASSWGPERFTDSQREQLRTMLGALYDRFLELVASGRDMTSEEVHEIARGRVWTGADAAKVGLVDEIGGLNKAVEIAAELAGLEEGDEYRVNTFPEIPEGEELFSLFMNVSSGSVANFNELNSIGRFARKIGVAEFLQKVESSQKVEARAESPTYK